MPIPRAARFVASLAVAFLPSVLLADPPTVPAGQCLYLVGAPAGAPAASVEERDSGTRVWAGTSCPAAHLGIDETGPNSLQVYQDMGNNNDSCQLGAWTEHHFRVSGSSPVEGRVEIVGAFDGFIQPWQGAMVLTLQLFDVTDAPSAPVLLDAREVLRHPGDTTSWAYLFRSGIGLSDTFGVELSAHVEPGRTYAVRLTALVTVGGAYSVVDFGQPGSGRNAHYDSIKVCLDPPSADAAVDARLAALEDDTLEGRLHARQCMASVWMPASQGGRLERARSLVGDLVAGAVATGDSGVNAHVASARLASADAQIAAGQYQRACRSLVDALHAVTTP